jgi:hypothetical protein
VVPSILSWYLLDGGVGVVTLRLGWWCMGLVSVVFVLGVSVSVL